MGIFGKRKKEHGAVEPSIGAPVVGATKVTYFEVSLPSGDAVCSDNDCPCPDTPIPKGTGYVYISPTVVKFRSMAPTEREAIELLTQTRASLGLVSIEPKNYAVPILVCERGARLRHLDLKTAAADARHWWETGLVPLRPTPTDSKKQRRS